MTDYRAAVENGYAWMEKNYPTDLEAMRGHIQRGGEFDMNLPEACMLQTIGWWDVYQEHDDEWMKRHGFMLGIDEMIKSGEYYFALMARRYRELESAWRERLGV